MAEFALTGTIRHQVQGRARIRLAVPLPSRASLEALVGVLGTFPGVIQVDLNPATASLLIYHDGDFAPIAAAAKGVGLTIAPLPETAAGLDPIAAAAAGVAKANALVVQQSGGRLDLIGVTFAGLVAIGLVQLMRGKIAGPALSVFAHAATLASARSLLRE